MALCKSDMKVRTDAKIMNLAQRIQNYRELLYRMFIAVQVPAKSQSMGQLQGTGKSHYCIETDIQEGLTSSRRMYKYSISDFLHQFNTFYVDQVLLMKFDNLSTQLPAAKLILII